MIYNFNAIYIRNSIFFFLGYCYDCCYGIAMVAAMIAFNPNPNGYCYGYSHGMAMVAAMVAPMGRLWLLLWLLSWDDHGCCYGCSHGMAMVAAMVAPMGLL